MQLLRLPGRGTLNELQPVHVRLAEERCFRVYARSLYPMGRQGAKKTQGIYAKRERKSSHKYCIIYLPLE